MRSLAPISTVAYNLRMDIPRGTIRRVGHSRSHFSIHGGRPTLCLLTSQLNRGFHRAAMRATSEAVRNLGANFICFDGGVLASAALPDATSAGEANILYRLIGPDAVDGAVIWSSALDWEVGEAGIEAFCRGFSQIPVVSVGRAFDGIPSVLVDNYQGMRAAVAHLIEDHGHRLQGARPGGQAQDRVDGSR
jgi:DNA-binding LacI/PurR family transcriptional regulator